MILYFGDAGVSREGSRMIRTRSIFASLALGLAWWLPVVPACGPDRGTRYDHHRAAGANAGTSGRDPAQAGHDRSASYDQTSRGNLQPAGSDSALAGRGTWERLPCLRRPLAASSLVSPARGGRPGRAGFRVWSVRCSGVEFLVRRRRRRRRTGPAARRRGAGPMGPGGPAAGVPPPPDQVALMTQRLQNFYAGNRKEAAYALGRLGDPRAVPSLIHVLKYDLFQDVRIAAAIALGEIGGSEAAIGLERCSIYDKREDVRKAATTALNRLNAKAKAAPPISSHVEPPRSTPVPPPPATSSPFRGSPPTGWNLLPNRRARAPRPRRPRASPASPQPPPPPTPVTAGPAARRTDDRAMRWLSRKWPIRVGVSAQPGPRAWEGNEQDRSRPGPQPERASGRAVAKPGSSGPLAICMAAGRDILTSRFHRTSGFCL